jgi:hypothetical protein
MLWFNGEIHWLNRANHKTELVVLVQNLYYVVVPCDLNFIPFTIALH